ncbi:MAG TPA: stage V sporulation protein AD, partial [Ruminococcaceae bacterium]|nr:stage V sporulation protein AD [Oscillospiraceae bacterium]
ETQTAPEHYDLILTGDLGKVGSKLLYDLLEKEYNINIRKVHNDTGLMMYYPDKQDVHAGGSGCG